jgi:hypothetical protein
MNTESRRFRCPIPASLTSYLDYECFSSQLAAIGASAVGIGKPVFFALGVGGEEALSYLLQLLRTELEAAMAICGVERISDITSNLVTRHPSAFQPTPTSPTFPILRSSL